MNALDFFNVAYKSLYKGDGTYKRLQEILSSKWNTKQIQKKKISKAEQKTIGEKQQAKNDPPRKHPTPQL